MAKSAATAKIVCECARRREFGQDRALRSQICRAAVIGYAWAEIQLKGSPCVGGPLTRNAEPM